MAKYISNRLQNLKIGIVSYTEDKTVLQVTGNVGIKTADTQGYELYVNGDANVSGNVTAQNYYGSGANLTGISTLGITSATNLTAQQLNVSGISTLGVTSTTNLTSQQLYVSGIATLTQISAGGTVGAAGSILSSTGSGLSWIPAASGGSALSIFTSTSSTPQFITFVSSASTTSIGITASNLTFIPSSGSLGIGTTNPTSTLTVNGNALFTGTGIVTATSFSGTLSGYASSAGIATNIKGGDVGNIPYQSSANTTVFLTNGGSGTVLQSNGPGAAPTWVAAAPSGAVSGITVRDSNSNLVGTSGSITQLTFGSGLSVTGTTGAAGIATITLSSNIVGTSLSISGISTFTNGPILVGAGTSTGTALQPLQVTGGAYVSGNLGIGTTNPTSKLHVVGDVRVTGVVTATTFVGALTGTATSTTNIPNLTGAITSVNTTTSLGSFSSANLATALTDETGSGSAVFATSPTLVTPVLGAASATSIVVSSGSTFTNGPILVGTGTSTGTALQPLQVTGGAYVSGNLGIGTTSPASKLHVIGDVRVTGVVTATTFVGALTGTATSTTNIPNLTGAITSVGTATTLGSFSSANLATALTDETGSGSAVFATSPTLVTPALGAATATSIVVGSGVTINASGINAAAGIITASQLSTGASGTGINITTNTISGPATLTIDPAAVGDNTGAVRIKGDLYVDGTQFIVNSTTIELADFNVGIATTVGTNALLDGAGIGIGSTGIRKTLTWSNSSTALKSSEDFDIASGKVYKINGTSVLSNTTLGSGVTNSSLTSVGTLGSLSVGNVNSTGIITATTFVGALTGTATTATNLNGGVVGNIPYQSAANTTVFLTNGDPGKVLQSNGVGAAPTWVAAAPTGAVTGLVVRDFNNNIVGTSGSVTQLTFSTGLSVTGTTGAAGIATITLSNNIVGSALSISGISTFTNGPVLIGSGTSTGTATQRLQVTGGAYVSGNLGIGTTNPLGTLQVGTGITMYGATGIISAVSYRGDGSQLSGISAGLTVTDDTSTNATRYILFDDATSGTISAINVSSTNLTFNPSTGNLVAGGTVTANSDEKLKENIKTIENALDKVLSLRGVEYDRIDTLEHQIGVIAQEVEKIVPEVVYPKQPAPSYETKSVAYANLVGLLIEAIKEQNVRIEELERKLGGL